MNKSSGYNRTLAGYILLSMGLISHYTQIIELGKQKINIFYKKKRLGPLDESSPNVYMLYVTREKER